MIDTALALLRVAGRLPRSVWAGVAAFAVLVGLWWAVASYGATRYEDGRQSVLRVTQGSDSVGAVVKAAHTEAVAKTDTVIQRVTVTRHRVDTLVQRIPDSVRVLVPVVDTLARVAVTLSAQVDTLTRAIDLERAAARLRFQVDSAALVVERTRVVALTDTVRTLERRPRKRAVAAAAILAGVVGYFGGRR